jgi:hypothetical protein
MTRGMVRMGVAVAILYEMGTARPAAGWGNGGHALVTRAALAAGAELPRWFRDEAAALVELSNGPDRWREVDVAVPALAARRPEHFFDLDVWGDEPLPDDRWRFARRAARRRLEPEGIGVLPFAMLEQYGELLSAFRDVRDERPGARAAALSAAGILAHLAGDAAVPLHATRHHHGWVGTGGDGFTRAPGVHGWFETDLVAVMTPADVRIGPDADRPLEDLPAAVYAAIRDSLRRVVALYEAERRSRVAGDDEPARALVRERLSAGATLTLRLWQTAWMRSARVPRS